MQDAHSVPNCLQLMPKTLLVLLSKRALLPHSPGIWGEHPKYTPPPDDIPNPPSLFKSR